MIDEELGIEFIDQLHMALAKVISESSPDPSTKVGAVIIRSNIVVGAGHNSFPHKCQQLSAVYKNRERKYLRVIHAEVKAVLMAKDLAHGATLYVWPPSIGPSCGPCSAIVIESGIERVCYVHEEGLEFNKRWGTSIKEGLRLYQEAKVRVSEVKLTEKFPAIEDSVREHFERINLKAAINQGLE